MSCSKRYKLTIDRATNGLPQRNGVVMHIGIDDGDGPLINPRYTSTTTEADAPSREGPLGQSDPALAVVLIFHPRLEEWAQPKRISWVGQRGGAMHTLSGKRATGRACYLCAFIGHQIPDVTWVNPPMRAQSRQRVMEAPPERQASLSQMTHYIAGLTPFSRDLPISNPGTVSAAQKKVVVKNNHECQASGNETRPSQTVASLEVPGSRNTDDKYVKNCLQDTFSRVAEQLQDHVLKKIMEGSRN